MKQIIRTQEELKQLLYNTPRMYWSPENHPCNYLHGLYTMIKDNLNDSMVMVEIGSYAAVSSHIFAENVKHIYCVDLWKAYHEVEEKYIIEGERLFDNFIKRYDNVTKMKMSSMDASKEFKDASLDFVYIDANHTYECVMGDINAWLPKVKPDGAIGGHDFHHGAVEQAVREVFHNKIQQIKLYEDYSWYVKK